MSGTLSCTATNCVNNMSGICSASTINVFGSNAHSSEKTQCETFAEKGIKNALANVLNNNIVGEFQQVFNSESIMMSPSIRCNATSCMHNESNLCAADNVMISGIGAITSGRTECETFKE
ncbi:DUF1540 domain-containing protein [Clostridium sp.]|uniref:DUF1540 domain-containing protein n=1 Tax=Clostridium sp. TaxID=1506 RepID=UPI003D6CA407